MRRRGLDRLQLLRDRAFVRQAGKCWWCGGMMLRSPVEAPAYHPLACTAEHLTPRSKGGHTTVMNITAAHAFCNHRRHRRSRKRHHKTLVRAG
jgi:5-methylcytosine-specific restriction endonuclease McrA